MDETRQRCHNDAAQEDNDNMSKANVWMSADVRGDVKTRGRFHL